MSATTYYEVVLKSYASGKIVNKFVKDPDNPNGWAGGWALYETREQAEQFANRVNKKEKRTHKNVKYTVRAVVRTK